MLPTPQHNIQPPLLLGDDAIVSDPASAELQTQIDVVDTSIVVDASIEVSVTLPLPASASTHLRRFNPSQENHSATQTAEMGFQKRNREFAVGRLCAHSHHYAWAVVAKQESIKGIGVDTEIIVDDATLNQVINEITNETEQELLSEIHTDVNTAFTVVFSAKESIYKCLYPMNEQFFGFHDVELIAATNDSVTFAQQPSNPNFSIAPRNLTVQYAIHQNDIFTTIWV